MQSLTTVMKIVGKSVAKEEVRAHIKARPKIDCSLKQISAEISVVYRSYDIVCRWKKFDSGILG